MTNLVKTGNRRVQSSVQSSNDREIRHLWRSPLVSREEEREEEEEEERRFLDLASSRRPSPR